MLKTPDVLQREYQVPANAGNGRGVCRIWFGYDGPHKSKLLATVVCMTVQGALPEYAGKLRASSPVSQHDLGAASNLNRETLTRRISLFSPRAEDARKDPVAVLIHRNRRFAQPNTYTTAIPARVVETKPEHYFPPVLHQLLQDPKLAALWLKNAKGTRGFKKVPRWVWDPRTPLSWTARLVLTYYILCGLLENRDRKGRLSGECHPRQSTVAEMCGLDVKTVRKANRELEAIGLVRVVRTPGKKDPETGEWKSGPQRILYLPIRTVTHEEAEIERKRLTGALQRAKVGTLSHVEALRVIEEILGVCERDRKDLRTFWAMLRQRLLTAGLPRDAVAGLVPRPPD